MSRRPKGQSPVKGVEFELACPSCGVSLPAPALISATVNRQLKDRIRALSLAEASLKEDQGRLAEELAGKDALLRSELQRARVEAEKEIALKVSEALRTAQERQKAVEGRLNEAHLWERHLLEVQLAEAKKGRVDAEQRAQKELLRVQASLVKAQFDREAAIEEGRQGEQRRANARVAEMQIALEKALEKQLKQEADLKRHLAQAVKEAESRTLKDAHRKHKVALDEAMEAGRRLGSAQTDQSHLAALRERDFQIQQLSHQVDELRRIASAGSPERKGGAAEDVFERCLREAFSTNGDQLLKTKRGQKGGDFRLLIGEASRKSILLEVKSTQDFESGWIRKAKSDRDGAQADVVVIVTKTLPAGIELIGQQGDVWVTSFEGAIPLLKVLREELIQVERARRLYALGDAELQALKTFLGGPQFRAQIECIVNLAAEQRKAVLLERSQHERMWTKHEQAINKTLTSAIRIWTEMDDRSGGALLESKVLAPFLAPIETTKPRSRNRKSSVA